MLIRDANVIGGTFLADYDKVKTQFPSAFRPIRLPLNKALVNIHCLDYIDTDIGPYREIAISVATHPATGFLPGPIKTLASAAQLNFHAYVLHLPVNTEISAVGGQKIFNFPKTVKINRNSFFIFFL